MSYLRKIFEGRMGRLDYLVGSLIFPAFLIILLGIILFLFPQGIDPIFEEPLNIFEIVIKVICFLYLIPFSIRRLHDLNKPRQYLLLMLIPFVNIFFGLYLSFWKGTNGKNKYGEAFEDSSIFNKFKRIFCF